MDTQTRVLYGQDSVVFALTCLDIALLSNFFLKSNLKNIILINSLVATVFLRVEPMKKII